MKDFRSPPPTPARRISDTVYLPAKASDQIVHAAVGTNAAVAFRVEKGERFWACTTGRSGVLSGRMELNMEDGGIVQVGVGGEPRPFVAAGTVISIGADLPNVTGIRMQIWRDSATTPGRQAERPLVKPDPDAES